MAKILVAEDEEKINELICRNLKLVGHDVQSALDGKTAYDMMEQNVYDLLLLDVMMPGLSGFEIAQKNHFGYPIIFVTAKDGLSSRLSGLDLGADDYITKPFEILELIARVKAVLRRTHKLETTFAIADIFIEFDTRRVRKNDVDITLTPKEFDLMETFVVNRNLALSRDRLLDLVWGYDFEGDIRTVDVHVQRLRSKLGLKNEIATVYKLGYRLNV